jgi:hypothetical protein
VKPDADDPVALDRLRADGDPIISAAELAKRIGGKARKD